ncbi:hypothetical protein FACS1894217_05580 [Clostridia bacterium]|nr:hypothetical protein FACS1894217_05580 [Clostridia bacterium]
MLEIFIEAFICVGMITVIGVAISLAIRLVIHYFTQLKAEAPELYYRLLRSDEDVQSLNTEFRNYQDCFKVSIDTRSDIIDDETLPTMGRPANNSKTAIFSKINCEEFSIEGKRWVFISINNKSDSGYHIIASAGGRDISLINWIYSDICAKQKVSLLMELGDKIDIFTFHSQKQKYEYALSGQPGWLPYKVVGKNII